MVLTLFGFSIGRSRGAEIGQGRSRRIFDSFGEKGLRCGEESGKMMARQSFALASPLDALSDYVGLVFAALAIADMIVQIEGAPLKCSVFFAEHLFSRQRLSVSKRL
ncbi:MAG: hypothetical protein IGR92_13760 [Leptolyngbyaceae cyanobacterium T60_A2020_046]|nr:hypothetical protein [Leptolyngbyaceae cyanobacterium T60_A2020_046]